MRDPSNTFHLAIPTHDLDAAAAFYTHTLGCRLARRYPDRITLDFFGDQLVCHLDPHACATTPTIYPRHFGVTFRRREDLDTLLARLQTQGTPLLQPPFTRFPHRPEAHTSFLLHDPSNNVIEFKHYPDPTMMY